MERITTWAGEHLVLPTGREVYVRHAPPQRPDAEPAVSVHGLGGSSANWTALMGELRADLDPWAFDLPGFGESPPADEHTIEAFLADVTAFLEQFDRPIHLLGNSMGGLISVLVASARPDLVATLTLLAPAMPQYRMPAGGWVTAALAIPRMGELMLSRVNDMPEDEQIARLAEMMYGDPTAVDPDYFAYTVEQRLRWSREPHSSTVLISALRSIIAHYVLPRRRQVWAAARHILCPTLVVLSGKDSLVGSRGVTTWRRALPRARVVYLPTSGHVAMMEHPALVGDLVRTFVRDASGGRTRPPGIVSGVAPLASSSTPI